MASLDKWEWKKIPDYEGYLACKEGFIFDKERNKILNGNSKIESYTTVRVFVNGIAVSRNAHRLIASTFIPNEDNKPVVNHINGLKGDNRVENLEWVTQSENVIHAHESGLIPKKKKRTLFYGGTIEEEYYNSLTAIAENKGLGVTTLIRTILIEFLNENDL